MSAFLKTWWGKVIAVLVALFISLSVVVGFYLWQLSGIFPDNINFNPVLWQTSTTDEQDTPRCLMKSDLEQNHLKLGMTRAEVIALLGNEGISEQGLSYYLGFCDFSIDGMSLSLEFSGENKLIDIRTLQH